MHQRLYEKIKNISRLDRSVLLVWQAGPKLTATIIFLIILQGIIPLAALYLMKLIVDTVSFSITAQDKIQAFQDIAILIGMAVIIAIFQILLQLILNFVKEIQSLMVTDHVSSMIHSKSIEVDLEYYEDPTYYDTLHRAQEEGAFRPTKIVNDLIVFFQSGISFAAMAALLFSFHYIVAMMLFLSVLPGFFVRLRYSDIMYEWMRRRTQTERKSSYYSWLLTRDEHAKEVRLFGFGNYFIKKYNALRKVLRDEEIKISKNQLIGEFFAQTGTTVAIFIAFAMVAYHTVHGNISLGDMVMYFQAFQKGLTYLKDFIGRLTDLYEDNLFVTNFYQFLDFKPKIKSPLVPKTIPRPFKENLEFKNVQFRYPSSGRNVLRDVSFTVKPNEVVALVGENGSGKTTLIKLLCRLYDPDKGDITLDGIHLSEFHPEDLRMEMGVIFQDFARYHMTVKDNIWLGNVHSPPDIEKISNAAHKADMNTFIKNLPEGYDTYLGKWFEKGEELSIGQWQRIALARAFLRDSQFIILDEPTSALDPIAEFKIFTKFSDLCKGKTVFLISHRFSTVKMADRILVLDNGKIIENGSHADLYQLDGKYANMYKKQAMHYHDNS